MLRKLLSWAFFVACLILSLASNADSVNGLPLPTIRANTRLVVVDVVVTDKKGHAVTNLKAEDFTVEENGKRQKISVFVPPVAGNQVAPEATPPGIFSNHPENVGPAGAPIVLVLDAANSQFKDQAYARSQMLKYVAQQTQSGRPMAVVALTDRLRVLQQFTTDPQILVTAIKRFAPQEPVLQPGAERAASATADASGATTEGSGAASAIARAQTELASFANLQIGYNIERRTLITIEAMRSLTRMLGGLQGRKNVVWLTANLPFDLIPEDRAVSDEQLLADLPGQGRQRSVTVNAAGSLAAQQRALHGQEIREAEAGLASANIAIYPVDLRGLLGGTENLSGTSYAHNNDANGAGIANAVLSENESLQASQNTMKEVAAETGGKAYTNQNEIKEGIALAAADGQASYQLGYYPDNKKWDGKYRHIKIKVAQGDAEVRYRKGYFAIEPAPSKTRNFEQDVASALQVNAFATQVSFMAQAKPTDPGKMRVVFLVDAHTLTAEDSAASKKINVSLYACVYDGNGKNLAIQGTKVDRAFDTGTYQQMLDKGMIVPIDMDIPTGGKELRLAVLDNKTGFVGTTAGPLGQ
jgi:VWFA-related protein